MKLKQKADSVFSEYIRLRDGRCFTCGSQNDLQAGHYIPRGGSLSLRFDERNTNCQCRSCNEFLRGNLDVYKQKLIEKYGEGIIEKLNTIKRTHKKMWDYDYEEFIAKYKQKIKEL